MKATLVFIVCVLLGCKPSTATVEAESRSVERFHTYVLPVVSGYGHTGFLVVDHDGSEWLFNANGGIIRIK